MSDDPNRTAQVRGASIEKLVSELETIAAIMVMVGLHVPHEEIQEEWLVWFGRCVEEICGGFSIARGKGGMSAHHIARRGLITCSALLLVAGAAGAAKAEELDGELIALCRKFEEREAQFKGWDNETEDSRLAIHALRRSGSWSGTGRTRLGDP